MNFDIHSISAEEAHTFFRTFSEEKSFLQSTSYGAWREKIGENILYRGIFYNDECIGVVLIQKITTRLKKFLHIPHGPLLKKHHQKALQKFLEYYKEKGEKEKCDFIRISPLFPDEKQWKDVFVQQGFRDAPIHLVNPERTWTLDISQTEEEILAGMRKSLRYEVKRIKKTAIEVRMGNTKKDLDIFWALHQKTVQRQKFVPFPKEITKKQLQVFGKNCQIFSASIDGESFASSIILFDDTSGYYHQAASKYSKFPVAHACLWSAILESKKRGCQEFNFWGVVKEEEKKHPWYGLSRFKRGFGGKEKVFLHAQDFPLTKKYWLNFWIEKYRKWSRGY